MLAPGTDVIHLATDQDDRIYAWITGAENSGLYRGGQNNEQFTRVHASTDIPTALEVSDGGSIYYATTTEIFRSVDGGSSFQPFVSRPGGTDSRITGIDIHSGTDADLIAVSVAADTPGQWGGVYVYDEADFFGGWMDAGIGSLNALDIRIPSGFDSDRTLLALATDGADTFIMSFGAGSWRTTPLRDEAGTSVAAESGSIHLPDDFNRETNPQYFVTVIGDDTSSGGIWAGFHQAPPDDPAVFPLANDADGNFNCLTITGTEGAYELTAGTTSGTILNSGDGGFNWQQASKNPAGETITDLASVDGSVWAATSGEGSGLFKSTDNGDTWDPFFFLDRYEVETLVKVLPSPDYAVDKTLYLLSFNGSHHLWRTSNEGQTWQKILSADEHGINIINHFQIANDGTLFIVADDAEGSLCLISNDHGATFESQRLPASVISTASFAAASEGVFFFTSFDGTIARLWRSEPVGLFENITAGDIIINDLEISPDFANDQTIIAAAANGDAFISSDAGFTLDALPDLPVTGSIRLLFDPDFGTSAKLYATTDTADAGIHRLTVGDDAWERVDSGLPDGTMLNSIAKNADGVFYAADHTQVSDDSGGLVRALSDSSAWHLTRKGLPDDATLWGLSIVGNSLWALDTTNNRVMAYTDTLAFAVEPTSPAAASGGLGEFTGGVINGIELSWKDIDGAVSYEWQLNDRSSMSSPALEETTSSAGVRVDGLNPNTTYYWRVRVAAPVPGPWSVKSSFTTALGGSATVPLLVTPSPGDADQAIRPIFQWHPVAGADGYELILADDPGFNNTIYSPEDIVTNAWQSQTGLAPGKTYYWKVRAVNTSSSSAWSAVSAFSVGSPDETSGAADPSTNPTVSPGEPNQITIDLPEWLGLGLAGMGGALVLLLLVLVIAIRNRRVL